jgi:WD40 repeat protein
VVDFLDMMALDKDQGVHPFAHPLLLSPDGKYLASDSRHFSTTRKFHVWEIGHRRLVVSHEKDTGIGAEPKMAFARDSRTFVLDRNSPNANRAVLAWDLASGKPAEVPDVTHRVDPVDPISPDGSRRLRIVDGGIKIEDRQTGRTVLEYRGYVWAIFSPDGHYILACKRDGAALLDASPFAQLSETR